MARSRSFTWHASPNATRSTTTPWRDIERIFSDPGEGVRAVVISARGEHFSAGLDLSSLTDTTPLDSLRRSQLWYRAFERIEFGNVPVVAALHGAVIAAARDGRRRPYPRCRYDDILCAARSTTRHLRRRRRIRAHLAHHRAASHDDLMFTGRIYGAEEGHTLGPEPVPRRGGRAEAKAIALAKQIATVPPLSTYGIMHAVPRNAEADPATGYVLEGLMAAMAAGDPVAQERIAAFSPDAQQRSSEST